MFQVKVLVVKLQNLGVLQHPQAPTCLRPCTLLSKVSTCTRKMCFKSISENELYLQIFATLGTIIPVGTS